MLNLLTGMTVFLPGRPREASQPEESGAKQREGRPEYQNRERDEPDERQEIGGVGQNGANADTWYRRRMHG